MGLFFSNLNNPPKPPHEVLGLPPLFTKSQARSQYLKLIRLNPTLISNYNSAYNILKNEPPNLNLYNHEVLYNSVLILDLFDRISDFSGFKCPEFRSPDFYKKFKNFNCPRKFKREEERNLFNFKIRKIIKEVYKIYECGNVGVLVDNREVGGSKVDVKDNSKEGLNVKDYNDNNKEVDNPIIKLDKQFKCSYCSKGFRSKNQLINHLKSKKHFEKIKEKEEEPKKFIKKEIENLEGGNEGDGSVGDGNEVRAGDVEGGSEVRVRDVEGGSEVRVREVEGGSEVREVEGRNVDNSEVKDIEVGVKSININDKERAKFINKDPIAFRTCSRCNKRFENRIKMIEHIKKDH